MIREKKHLNEYDVKTILFDYSEEVQPFYELVESFNMLFGDIMFERMLGFKKRTKIFSPVLHVLFNTL